MRTAPDWIQTALVTGTSGTLAPWLGKIMAWSAGLSRLMRAEWLADTAIKQHHIDPRFRELVFDDLVRASDPGFNVRVSRALVDLQLPKQATMPFLALVGGNETYFAKSAMRKIVSSIHGAQGALVPDVGHLWNLQQPELFCEVVRSWVTRQEMHSTLQRWSSR
jgi:pimeloyl-ACP methyl ester carboxylesterase